MPSCSDSVAVIGAGLMGEGIASRLLAGGMAVGVVPHRDRAPIDRLVAQGAREHASLSDLVGESDVVLSCLPNSQVVESVAEELAGILQPGTLWLDVTTGQPEITRALAGRLASKGIGFADAPVTGGPAQAAEGVLTSLVGCDSDALPRVSAVTNLYSKATHHFGPAGSGHTAKLLNNFVSQGTMILLGQAFRAARAHGVDWPALYEAMSGGAARSGTLEKAVLPALSGDFDGSAFTIGNAEKDLRYALDLFDEGAPLPAALHNELIAYIRAGRGDAYVSRQLEDGVPVPTDDA